MGAIRPGSGGGGGASALGDLSDIGVMGEDIGQADDLTEVVTAMGGAAAVRTAIDVAQDGPTVTYTLGGTVTDYTADSAYAPSGLSAVTGGSVSGRLGAGIAGDVPYFSALYKGSIAALARNANGVRVTHTTANDVGNPWPYAAGGGTILIPLVAPADVQIDLRYAVNTELIGRCTSGSDIVEAFLGLVRADHATRPYTIAGVWVVTLNAVNGGATSELAWGISTAGTFTTTDTARDVSSAGQGTSAGVTVRDVRVVLKGATMEILTGPAGGSLTRYAYYADVQALQARDGLAVAAGLCQNQATPAAGYWIELRALTITPL